MRDGLPRAYLRMDPNIDQHPDFQGMVQLMCAAARQPVRGRFKHREIVVGLLGETRTRAMIRRADLVKCAEGLYLDGWDEWQEGDMTVAERMRRMRARRKHHQRNGVTERTSPRRNDVTTDAYIHTSQGLVPQGVGVGEGVDERLNRTPRNRGATSAPVEPVGAMS